jgi:hypothetical protein
LVLAEEPARARALAAARAPHEHDETEIGDDRWAHRELRAEVASCGGSGPPRLAAVVNVQS